MPIHQHRRQTRRQQMEELLREGVQGQGSLPVVQIGRHDQIQCLEQACNYVIQKMRSGEKWNTVDTVSGAVISTAAVAGVTIATGGVGAAAAGAIGISQTAGQVAVATAADGLAAPFFSKIGNVVGKGINRPLKCIYKAARGTLGQHRQQAANILMDYASGMQGNNSLVCVGGMTVAEVSFARKVVALVLQESVEHVVAALARDNGRKTLEKRVYDELKTTTKSTRERIADWLES